MNEILDEQISAGAQTAEAENFIGANAAEVSPKKFKSAEALIKAYTCLEAEFTRKCRRIKELEAAAGGTSSAENAQAPELPPACLSDAEFIREHILTNKLITDMVISKYLSELALNRVPRVIAADGGFASLTPQKRPKSITEAGKLAERILRTY